MSDAVISNELNKQSSGRLLSIDLLRAVAAFGVFLFHASLTAGFDKFSLSVHIPGLDRALAIPNFLSLGAMGVSLFFVVSGYCLARSRGRGNAVAELLCIQTASNLSSLSFLALCDVAGVVGGGGHPRNVGAIA